LSQLISNFQHSELKFDNTLLLRVEMIARQTGQVIIDFYQSGPEIGFTDKNDGSPLTKADLLANSLIVDELRKLTPEIPTLSEESVEEFAVHLGARCYWLVDPLDGTKEFVHHCDEFTVNIALIYQGEPLLGVVYAPALDLLYSAIKDGGAFLETNRARSQISSNLTSTPPELKILCSRYHKGELLEEWLKNNNLSEVIPMGSSLKLCKVADGTADIYPRFGPTSLWDIAAGQCIVEEAGGCVLDLNGHKLKYLPQNSFKNPSFFVLSNLDLITLINPLKR
jgi:3'(2'), 5'-bisphosphate nucleotidase